MTTAQVISLIASVTSIVLAIVAIGLTVQQRKESQSNFDKTQDSLAKMDSMVNRVDALVSEHFQKMLSSIVEQQRNLTEYLRPHQSPEERYTDLVMKVGSEEPEKLAEVVEALEKFSRSRRRERAGGETVSQ